MENYIKDNKNKFMVELPAGHQERFAMKLQKRNETEPIIRRVWFGISSAAAAVILALLILGEQDNIKPNLYNENEKVVEMRRLYEQQLDKTIMLLEDILDNVDDSTRNEINMLIESMNHTTEVFAEIAPLPEEKQLSITSQIYNNKLQTLNSIYIKLNKNKEE